MDSDKFTLYIDESGGAALTDTRSRYFMLTGIAVNNGDDSQVSGFFDFLKRRHGIKNFHSFDIFEDRSSDAYLSDAKSKQFTTSLAEFIDIAPIQSIVVAIDKDEIAKYFSISPRFRKDGSLNKTDFGREVRDIAYDILASKIFFWFTDEFLVSDEASSPRGSIVAESRKSSDHSLLTAFLDCKESSKYRTNPAAIHNLSKVMESKVTSIKFENKIGQCPGLETADLVSFVSFLSLNRRASEFKNRVTPRLKEAIVTSLDKGGIQMIHANQIPTLLPAARVHRISEACKKTYSDSL